MFEIYKKSGAIQLKLIEPKDFKSGAIYIEMAKGVDSKKYDWENKINFAIGPSDIPNIMYEFYSFMHSGNINLELVHFPNQGNVPKKLTIKNGQKEKTYAISLFYQNNNVFIYLTSGEMLYLYEIIKALSVKMLFG